MLGTGVSGEGGEMCGDLREVLRVVGEGQVKQ